jgi:hypothetical protein
VRVLEEADALLVRLEGELKVLVLLEEGGIVEQDLHGEGQGRDRDVNNFNPGCTRALLV